MSNTRALRDVLCFALAEPDDRFLDIALSAQSTGAHSSTSSPSGGDGYGGEDAERQRIRALVDLARNGDSEAFGQLYDHYCNGIFRFVYYRTSSHQLAEDLTSETFLRGLRAIQRFNWQGKDFGAWLTTIARNLIADHYKSSRSRLEIVSDDVPEVSTPAPSTEAEVLALISNQRLLEAVSELPGEQRECILMRFIQGLSIAETAAVLGRSEGAVKQLQLRAVRGLAKRVGDELR